MKLLKTSVNKLSILTQKLEKTVPNIIKRHLGSRFEILLFDNKTQVDVIIKNPTNGISGLIASKNGLIFPVLFLYDL